MIAVAAAVAAPDAAACALAVTSITPAALLTRDAAASPLSAAADCVTPEEAIACATAVPVAAAFAVAWTLIVPLL
ncbi:MAG TPA: hypothetical protein VNT24_10025, partial [Propionibacteriaceae bacterium]|nr:hypothetical protein [Propionibacteriaceae bacterium]